MKIASYNLWDSSSGMPLRFGQLRDEIRAADADILCLQEVEGSRMHRVLSEDCGYAHSHHLDAAGVSILSRWPLVEAHDFEFACAALIKAPGHTLLAASDHYGVCAQLEFCTKTASAKGFSSLCRGDSFYTQAICPYPLTVSRVSFLIHR